MTAFFPQSYPDELLISICSRYHERLNYKSSYSTGRDLFGYDRIQVAVDLPNSIGQLCKSLPVNHPYTAEDFIHQNTLYPLFSAFVSPERASALRKDMIGPVGGAHGRAGVLTSKIQYHYFKFCPMCAAEDRTRWGETYWHRIHNVPRVLVCPIHHIPTQNSGVDSIYRISRERFVTAERIIRAQGDASVKARSSDSSVELLGKLASDFLWLLSQRDLCADSIATCSCYRRLLFEQGFATYTGVVRRTELKKAFLNFYPERVLYSLGCELPPDLTSSWLTSIVQNSHKNSSHSAIQHLLLMNFLNCSVQSFFSLPKKPPLPFAEGPWPCLNPIADHFREPIITTCKISATNGSPGHRTPRIPIGTFTCECGFTYRRRGPDESGTSRFQFYRIDSYGHAWYANLKRLVEVHGYSVRDTAALLNVTPHIVRVELARLRASETNPALKGPKPSKKKKVTKATIKKCRAQWKAALKANPGSGRVHLSRLCGHQVYHVLLSHDREWFNANSPRLAYSPLARMNWKQRDRELAELARKTSEAMINGPGRPRRASRTALARELRILTLIHQRPKLLPLTKEVISKSAESAEEFALRRVRLYAHQYRDENIRPTLHQLRIRAAIGVVVWNRIKDEVDSIVQNVWTDSE